MPFWRQISTSCLISNVRAKAAVFFAFVYHHALHCSSYCSHLLLLRSTSPPGFRLRDSCFPLQQGKSVINYKSLGHYCTYTQTCHPWRLWLWWLNNLTFDCYAEKKIFVVGHDTKTMLNNSGPRYKRSQLERKLNADILWCVLLLLIMCLFGALGKSHLLSWHTRDCNVPDCTAIGDR